MEEDGAGFTNPAYQLNPSPSPQRISVIEDIMGRMDKEEGPGTDTRNHKPREHPVVQDNISEDGEAPITETIEPVFVTSLEHTPPEETEDLMETPAEAPPASTEERYGVIYWTGDVFDEHLGRSLFFEDGHRRIDFVLVWNTKEKREDRAQNQKSRDIFQANLEEEGLQTELDIKEGRAQQYMKIHATWEVLTRYAEIMKIRMPMNEVPDEIKAGSIWEVFTDTISKLMSPFNLDPQKVPPVPKKFTSVFERDKEYLFAIPNQKELFFSHAQRSRIVDYILRRKRYSGPEESFSFGITRLLSSGVYVAAYPVHEGSWKPWTKPSMRRLLYENWAHWRNFYKVQPLDYIRTYFGEKIGLYFAWLGFYTWMLIPASVVGLAVFIYGVVTIKDNIIAQETCDPANNFTMCPSCDLRCPYWRYNVSCSHVRSSHMFDNGGTVFFAFFMSFWATFFLEFWKREQAGIQFKWNLLNFEEEEEPPRPEYLMKLADSTHKKKHVITGVEEPYVPFWRMKVPIYMASFSVMLFMVLIAITIVIGVIVYRMAISSALYLQEEELLYKNASMVTTATAACINLIVIFILNYIYTFVAEKLTDWECLRTQSEYDDSLTIKLYCLQFVNYYCSIFYVAFVKGRFLGRPGKYNKFFGARQEECQAGGCLIELAIQLAIIFVGKQLIQNNLMEILLPRLKRWIKKCRGEKKKNKNRKPWEKDFILQPLGQRGLFTEYLEMLLQFGFVTIFVAAFPLAPLFALMNNIIEIRADANKFVTQLRRPMALRAQAIGIWYDILYGLSRLAVLSNAMIIAFTSGFIHRLVYTGRYSPDGTLRGYVNHSLAYFDVNDFSNLSAPIDEEGRFSHIKMCRYQAFRSPPWADPRYKYTVEYWHIAAAQFIFIVIFENVVIVTTSVIAYLIPDMPRKLREQVHREAYLSNEIILKTELKLAHGDETSLSAAELRGIRRRIRGTILAAAAMEGAHEGANADTADVVDETKPPDEEESYI